MENNQKILSRDLKIMLTRVKLLMKIKTNYLRELNKMWIRLTSLKKM